MSFEEFSTPLLALPEVQSLKNCSHHLHTTRYDHSLRVAENSYKVALRLHLDVRSCVRAAIVHDLFWQKERGHKHKHFNAPSVIVLPEVAERNAERILDLEEKEKNIILCHMWPVARHWPHSREAWVIVCVDKYVALREFLSHRFAQSEV